MRCVIFIKLFVDKYSGVQHTKIMETCVTTKTANDAQTRAATRRRRKKREEGELPRLAFSLKETAQILGVSYSQAYKFVRAGLIRSCSVSAKKIIPRSEIERFLRRTLA